MSEKKRTVAIVQARWGSSRLPGKVLMPLGGKSVLGHVIDRCRAIKGVDLVCCAVAEDAVSDPVATEAARHKAEVWRGPVDDVLERYRGAAQHFGAEVILRVTSDCPVIDPAICAEVIELSNRENLDYTCNNMPPTWPHGLDCEVFPRAILERAAVLATAPYDREHVTPWIRNAPGLRRANLEGPGGPSAELRWTLDYPEDKVFFQQLWAHLESLADIPLTAHILAILDDHRELQAINAIRIDHKRLATACPPLQGSHSE
jgi:spore coat polysaccharide biosynthesis protein SpsF (cytidylyltransferase family)